jgi:enamine deaminase RidA (YjgF/YER057c/UK114 family)
MALGHHRVATTVVAATLLEDGWLVEIEAIAAA